MKVALLADTQFDEFSSLSTLLPSGITSRLQDQLDALAWVVDAAVAKRCTQLITLGDVFDSRTELNLSVIDAVCRAYHRASTRLDLAFMVGNHDAYLRSSDMNSLQMFRGYAEVIDRPTVMGPFAYLPWVDDVEAVKASVKTLAGSKADYLFMHGIIHGAVHKSVAGIPLESIVPKRWKRVFLGDVHEPRDMAPNVHYVGSFMQHHFGDAGGFRGFVVLDVETGTFERVENKLSPRFHIIKDGGAGPDTLNAKDFVSIEIEDATVAADVAARIRKKVAWVRAPPTEVAADVPPRLDIRSTHEHSDIVHRYCEHHSIDDPDLEKLGLELLQQARKVTV